MMLGTRKLGYSTLKLSRPKALPEHMRGPFIELSALSTEEAKRNLGSALLLMKQVTREADLHNVMLFLSVAPDDDMDAERLTRFYIAQGFVPIQTGPVLMVRPHAGMVNG